MRQGKNTTYSGGFRAWCSVFVADGKLPGLEASAEAAAMLTVVFWALDDMK